MDVLRFAVLAAVLTAGCSSSSADDSAVGGASALGDETFQTYAQIAADHGSPVERGKVTVVGIRGITVDGVHHDTRYHHAFDDTFVVLKADGTAVKFAGSTHPFENTADGVPDVNGDDVPDVGMIAPGLYDVVSRDGKVNDQASYWVTLDGELGALPGWRDTNHDGVISDAERAAADHRGDHITAVLFHDAEGTAPPAVGCQVFASATMKSFIGAVGGSKAKFRYVLVDAPKEEN